MAEKMSFGGQGVIEGVMMKSPNYIAVSVRKEDGSIASMHEKLKPKSKLSKIFFIRGIYNLIEMLFIGIKALIWSGNQAAEEEGKDGKEAKKEEFSTWDIILLLLTSFGFALLLFVAIPYVLTIFTGVKEEAQPFIFNLIDGIIKIAIFIIYILVISRMNDVKRIFQYHGAEHMAVHCNEHKEKLTVENVKKYPTIHPRCGSSFLMLVFIISILMFSIIPSIVLLFYPSFLSFSFLIQKLILFPIRILCIPLIAGISYEVLKFTDKYSKNPVVHVVAMPGLWLQKLTTKKPDDSMIEVAINSLSKVIELEKKENT